MTQETTNKRAKDLIKKINELGNELIQSKLIHKYEYDIDGDDKSDNYDDWWIIFHLCMPEYDVGYVHVSDVKKAYEKIMEYFPNCEPELYHWNPNEDFVITTTINGYS